jgi:hypothetical protein
MRPETLLWRQIHPSFLEQGRPGSQAFRPTPKDGDRLSCEDGDQITAEASWRRYTGERKLASVGVLAVTVAECEAEALGVLADGTPVPEHVSIDFGGKSNGQRKTISKLLRDRAVTRGWRFSA